MGYQLDKFKDECGVMGVLQDTPENTAAYVYLGLYALQHRGQESCGIAVNNDTEITQHRGMGLVGDVFTSEELKKQKGEIAIGHVRYSTAGDSDIKNAQPLTVNCKDWQIALAHNGNLVNADAIKNMLQDEGVIFMTSSDTEVIANLIARNYKFGIVETLKRVGQIVKGAYALVLTMGDMLIGVRDPYGLRPLCLGKLENGGYALASESCALDAIGATLVRDIEPGEIIVISDKHIESYKIENWAKPRRCIFELVYFARPDSVLDGDEVHESRAMAGKLLAKADKGKINADVVMAVPDSGVSAAIGYAEESGIPYGVGLIKNRYIGRTFIQPTQAMREEGVDIKLNILKSNVKDKSVVLIDDSIVRGTTSKRIVDKLRKAGAREIHFRVASPPTSYSCFFGIDTPNRDKLISSKLSLDEIKEFIGADSLYYLTIDELKQTVKDFDKGYCMACFNGDYPMEVPFREEQVRSSK